MNAYGDIIKNSQHGTLLKCQGKVEMSASWQSRNVRFGVSLWKRHGKLIVPVKQRRAMLASTPPRNSRSELIVTMGMAQSSRCAIESRTGAVVGRRLLRFGTRCNIAHRTSVLDLRDRTVFLLAVLVGMMPGEIFALRWGRVDLQMIDIAERVYRGLPDDPKTERSKRRAALPPDLASDIGRWREISTDTNPVELGRAMAGIQQRSETGQADTPETTIRTDTNKLIWRKPKGDNQKVSE